VNTSKVKFTKHAIEKLKVVKRYSFEISREQVVETVLDPKRLDKRGDQYFAIKIINSKHALRVVYERGKAFSCHHILSC